MAGPVFAHGNLNQYFSTFQFLFDGINRARHSMLRSAQPDLIYPVWCLTRLNADRVISGVLQYAQVGILSTEVLARLFMW